MNDFLIQYYSLVTHSVEALAAFTGLLLYRKYKDSTAKYFIYFLFYSTLCDTLGSYTKYVKNDGLLSFLDGTLFQKNYWWFTLFWSVFSIVFYTFYYNKIIKNAKFKSVIKNSGYAFFLFSVGYIIINFDSYFKTSLPPITVFGALIIFLCTVFYFIEILLSDTILVFYKSLNFYISITIFIWWLIITPLGFFERYFFTSDWDFVFLKWQIYLFANIFMYLTFTFALIWCRPQNE